MNFWKSSTPAAEPVEGQPKPIVSSAIRSDVIAAAGLSKCRDLHRAQMGYEHIQEKAGPFHRCIEEYQRDLGGWMSAETGEGKIYWFNNQLQTQWQRPEPMYTDIKKALDKAQSPNAWEDYTNSEPWDVCEFVSLRWFGCTQREGVDTARCTKELQDYARCLQTHNHPAMAKPAGRRRR